MAELVKCIFLVVFTVIVCGQNDQGLAVNIDISPADIDTFTQNAVNTISCIPGASIDQVAQEIMVLQITKEGDKPLTMLRPSCGITNGTKNLKDFHVEGRIDKVPSKSYLKLSLMNPVDEDAGMYQCVIYYLDDAGRVKEKRAEAQLNKQDLRSVVNKLMETVSDLNKELKSRSDRERYLINKMAMLETSLRANLTSLEEKFQSQIPRKNGNDSPLFSARYTVKKSDNVGDTVVFNEVLVNIGQNYDKNTGLFTAPRPGIYGFHLSAMLWTNYGHIDLLIHVNDKIEAALSMASDNIWDQSATSAFLPLKANDIVKVVVGSKNSGMKIRTDSVYTSFIGYLFHETD